MSYSPDTSFFREALADAGENSVNIERVYEGIRDDNQKMAFAFIISNMPLSDLSLVDPERLLDEIEYTFYVKNSFVWGRECPDDIFYHYVLPQRVSQEPLEYYRGFLLSELSPLVDTLKNAVEAAIEINKWCAERVVFKQTQRQDQGVFETLKSGYGRCEEMAIIYVSALRSCCIPARSAWTPYWTLSDNNHAWVEVFADGKWNYTGGCEPRPTLNDAWFSNSVKNAPVVVSACYGSDGKTEDIYINKSKYSIVYSTSKYGITPARLNVTVDSDSVSVSVSIYNWGALREILTKVSGSEKVLKFELNEGQYYVSAGKQKLWADTIVSLSHGESVNIHLEPSNKNPYTGKVFDMIFSKD
jgi:hypothetical protein